MKPWGKVYPLLGREGGLCKFCGGRFKGLQGVRAHLKTCVAYARARRSVPEVDEPRQPEAGEVEPKAEPETEVPACLLTWSLCVCRLARLRFKFQNEMCLALRESAGKLDSFVLNRMQGDEELCWDFFVDFVRGHLKGPGELEQAFVQLPDYVSDFPYFNLEDILARLRAEG